MLRTRLIARRQGGGRRGRIFYVDPAGSDAADGLSAATAWATVGKVNAAAFQGGDQILFKRGGVWRETLTVPGNGLRVGAYGSGAQPVLTGADLRSIWTTEPGTSHENFLDGAGPTPYSYWTMSETSGNRLDGVTANNNDLVPSGNVARVAGPGTDFGAPWACSFDGAATTYLEVPAADISAGFPNKSGTDSSITFGGWFKLNNGNPQGLFMIEQCCALFVEVAGGPVKLTVWDDSGTTSAAVTSDAAPATGTWLHIVGRYDTVSKEVALFINGTKQVKVKTLATVNIVAGRIRIGEWDWWGGMSGAVAAPFVFATALTNAQIADIAAAGLGGGTTPTLYYAAQATDPGLQVFRDGARLARSPAKAGLPSGSFWFDAINGRLYLRDDPAGHAIEVSARDTVALVGGRSDVTLDGLDLRMAKRFGVYIGSASARVRVQNCTLAYHGLNGYAALTKNGGAAMPDLAVSGCTAAYNGGSGIVAGSNVPRWRVSGCTCHHNALDPDGGLPSAHVRYAAEGLVGRPADAYTPPPAGAVQIAAGATIQTVIDANPAGTTYSLAAGTYTGQTFTPKNGDRFFGAPDWTTVLDGAGAAKAVAGQNRSNVEFHGIRFTRYAAPTGGIGVLGTDAGSLDFVVDNCEFDNNTAGAPLMLGTRMTVRHCRFHDNEWTGIGGYQVTSPVVEYNDIDHNTTTGKDPNGATADKAGIKITRSTGSVVRANYVHRNYGTTGIWFDIGCDETLIEGNLVLGNGHAGIMIEIDYGSEVRNNTIVGNDWVGIYLSNASSASVHHNEVRDNGGGIWLFEEDRGAGTQGTYLQQNCPITANIISMSSGNHGYGGTAGGTAKGNTFTRNAYRLAGSARFVVNGGSATFAAWQAAGEDTAASGSVLLADPSALSIVTGIAPEAPAGIVIEDCTGWRGGHDAGNAKVASGPCGAGFWLDRPGAGSVIRRCVAYNNAGAGIAIDYAGAAGGVVAEHNLAFGNDAGVALSRQSSGVEVRHNTVRANRLNLAVLGEIGGDPVGLDNNVVRDNVAVAATGRNLLAAWGGENVGGLSSGNAYHHNALGVEAAGFVEWGWGNALDSYAALTTAYGQAMSNVQTDPLLADPATGDFRLQAGSPCLGAASDGTDLGAAGDHLVVTIQDG